MKHKLRLAGTVVALAGIAGATGSAAAAPVIPKQTLIRRADAACTDFHKRARQVPEPKVDFTHLRARDLPAIAHYVGRLHPIMLRLDRRLHGLGRPDAGARTWKLILREFEGDMRLLDAQGTAARHGDLGATRRAIARSESPGGPGERGSKLAREFGLKACG